MAERLIFVSCGQLRADEKHLGQRIKAEIDAVPGFKAYFADSVQDLSGLTEHIFNALRCSSGAVVVLQPRGEVHSGGQILSIRSSVWINQEIAILAYRQFFEKRKISILAFHDPSVTLEGAMTAFIVNAKPFVDEERVLAELRRWLLGDAASISRNEDDVFQEKWDALLPEDRTILAALIAEGGRDIKEESVRRRLVKSHGLDRNVATAVLHQRHSALSGANLVQFRSNIYDGSEMSLHPQWEWSVRHALGLAPGGEPTS